MKIIQLIFALTDIIIYLIILYDGDK